MNAIEIRTIIGIIGNVTYSLFVIFSEMQMFIEIYKKKSINDFEPILRGTMVVNHSFWILYGIPLVQGNSILVSTSSVVGFLIEVIYAVVFIFVDFKMELLALYLYLVSFEIGIVAYIYGTTLVLYKRPNRRIYVGWACNVSSIAIYGYDLVMNRFKNMPFWLLFISFINHGIWTAYSLIYKIDIFVLISNGVGMLVCASQILSNAFDDKSTATVVPITSDNDQV